MLKYERTIKDSNLATIRYEIDMLKYTLSKVSKKTLTPPELRDHRSNRTSL